MELIGLISIRIDEVRSQRGQDITELARRAGIKNKTLVEDPSAGTEAMKAERACRSLLRPQARLQPFHQREDPGRPRCQMLEGDSGSEHEPAQLRALIRPAGTQIHFGLVLRAKAAPKQEKRQILPQDYYDSRQVMALLKLSKQKYYELVEREDDPSADADVWMVNKGGACGARRAHGMVQAEHALGTR